jgi:hypothetical protein
MSEKTKAMLRIDLGQQATSAPEKLRYLQK